MAKSFPDDVTVHYNPADPGESFLIQTSRLMLYIVIAGRLLMRARLSDPSELDAAVAAASGLRLPASAAALPQSREGEAPAEPSDESHISWPRASGLGPQDLDGKRANPRPEARGLKPNSCGRTKPLRPDDIVDNRYVQELETSGFVQRLYSR